MKLQNIKILEPIQMCNYNHMDQQFKVHEYELLL
jgi:hypothetical protein